MRTNYHKFTDEKILEILHEYFTTEITQPELMKKYNFGGPNSIYRWMKKPDISKQDMERSRPVADDPGEAVASAREHC